MVVVNGNVLTAWIAATGPPQLLDPLDPVGAGEIETTDDKARRIADSFEMASATIAGRIAAPRHVLRS